MRLTDRDYQILEDVARFRFLSSYHLDRRHFLTESRHRHIVALNRLALLVKNGYLTKGSAYPRWNPGKKQHKIDVYTWLPANQHALRKQLEESARAHLWDARFARHAERLPTTKTFSAFTMFHELLLTDFLLWLEEAVTREGWRVVFWERYGPREEDITGVFPTKNGPRRFNPDLLVCLRSPDGRHYFRTGEIDKNSTSQEGKFREKLEGHLFAESSGHYGRLIARKARDYNIPVPNPDEAQIVSITVTHTRERRNALLIESASLNKQQRFLFACIDDLKPEEGLAPVWLRVREYAVVVHRDDYPEHALTSVRNAWVSQQLDLIRKVSMVPKLN
jgi:hypothetical protein